MSNAENTTEYSAGLRTLLEHPAVAAEYETLEERIRAMFPILFTAFWNEGRLDTIEVTWSPEIVFDDGTGRGLIEGFVDARESVFALRAAFEDGHYEIEDVAVEGDKAVARVTYTGVHAGDLFGLPPTNRRVRLDEAFVFRFAETGPLRMQIVEARAFINVLRLLQQVGLFPRGNPPRPFLKMVISLQKLGRRIRGRKEE